jgi:DNA repair protein RadC
MSKQKLVRSEAFHTTGHYTMKELPDSEKPYEKCIKNGAKVLTDAELLAVILRTGSRRVSALQLAQEILCQKQKSLLNLNLMQIEELMKISGIGRIKAVQLKCIAELSKRIAQETYHKGMQVTGPETIAAYYMEQLRHETKEKLMLAMFDGKNHFLGDEVISVGTVNASLVSPREIFLKALEKKAVYIIMLHNHPSGDPSPSKEDERVTYLVAKSGELLGITLADHIVIGDSKYVSFREKGILN